MSNGRAGGWRWCCSIAALAATAGACQTNTGDAGCRINKQLVLPPTELTLLRNARLLPLDADHYVLIGHDDTAVRWATIDWSGNVGAEQTLPIPAGHRSPRYALANTAAPNDTVLIGLITDAVAGDDAEIRIVNVPIAGPTTVAPGPALIVFRGAAGAVPEVALATGRLGTNAALAWVDATEGIVNYIPVDGTGALVGTPIEIDRASAFKCLTFSAGNGNATAGYQRFGDSGPPLWMVAELAVDGTYMNWSLPLSQPNVAMGCAVMTPWGTTNASGYALAWQDASGSWLSVHTARMDNNMPNRVNNYPFASATDFGGPDLQPPIVGLAAFAVGVNKVDFGVVFQRPRAVEVWRLESGGGRRPGALLLPSLEGNMGDAASVVVGQSLVVTYADYTPSTQTGRRLLIDAGCY
jgi:hypothetical protein